MKRRAVIGALTVGAFGLCVACNFIIAADFEGYQAGNPYSAGCALTEADAGTPCGECIATKCKSDLDVACTGGESKSWFFQMKSCAQRPSLNETSPGYGCDAYKSDAGALIKSPTTDDERKQNAAVCIRDQCMSGDGAKCRTCDIRYKGNPDVLLGPTACGKCVFSKCYEEIMSTCSAGTASAALAPCAALNIGDNKTRCAAAFKTSDAGYPAEKALHTCLQQCETDCLP